MKKPIKRCTGGRTLVLIGPSSLAHSGVKGMKHGVRQYQNRDGTWTELGKERRRKGDGRTKSSIDKSNFFDRDNEIKEKAKQGVSKYDTRETKKAIRALRNIVRGDPKAVDEYIKHHKGHPLGKTPRELAASCKALALDELTYAANMYTWYVLENDVAPDLETKSYVNDYIVKTSEADAYIYMLMGNAIEKKYTAANDADDSDLISEKIDYVDSQYGYLKQLYKSQLNSGLNAVDFSRNVTPYNVKQS